MSDSPDPFEFVKALWGQMGVPGFGGASGPSLPTFAPEDLEKRLAELRQIRQWLEINLNMLNLQVNGLEMQLAALKGLQSAARPAAAAPSAGGFPFGATPAPAPAAAAAASGGATGAGWADATSWMQSLQAEFIRNMQSLSRPGDADAGGAPRAAKKPSPPRPTARKPRRAP
ncbi:MAG: hypothetical protein JNM90_07165 [Burkholderiales bacterium]|nr:hypothetical protein [Burkholderiales bacterium]